MNSAMKNKPHFISICSQKGGVGKSTFTILLAGMLHYRIATTPSGAFLNSAAGSWKSSTARIITN